MKLKQRLARVLARCARRLDPQPYGEWDHARSQLVVMIPTGGGASLPLARVDISPGAAVIGGRTVRRG